VPKVAIHEDDELAVSKNEIGAAWQLSDMLIETETGRP
jgi:hypothetical protein